MWVLVLIILQGTLVDAQHMGSFASMEVCFEKRAELVEEYGASRAHFPADIQAICIRRSSAD